MVMEYWSGWFDVWGEHHHVFHAEGTETLFNHFSIIFPSNSLIFSITLFTLHSLYYALTSSTMADVCLPVILEKPYECNSACMSLLSCWVQVLFKDTSTDREKHYLTTHLLLHIGSLFVLCHHLLVYRHGSCCVRDPGERHLH